MTRDEAIHAWRAAAASAKQWAEYERQLRDYIVGAAFTDQNGTQNLDLGGGYGLKLIRSSRVKVEDSAALYDAMNRLQHLTPDGSATHQLRELLKWKPETTLGRWNAAPAILKTALSASVTITPNAPQLTFEEPK